MKPTNFKPTFNPSKILSSGKDIVPASKHRGVKFHVGNVNTNTLDKRSFSNRSKGYTTGTLCLKITKNILKNSGKNSFKEKCSPEWQWFRQGLRPRFTSRK